MKWPSKTLQNSYFWGTTLQHLFRFFSFLAILSPHECLMYQYLNFIKHKPLISEEWYVPDSTLLSISRQVSMIMMRQLASISESSERRSQAPCSYFIFSSSILCGKSNEDILGISEREALRSQLVSNSATSATILYTNTTTLMVVTLENFNIVNLKSSLTSKKMPKTSKWTIIAGKIKHKIFQFSF